MQQLIPHEELLGGQRIGGEVALPRQRQLQGISGGVQRRDRHLVAVLPTQDKTAALRIEIDDAAPLEGAARGAELP